MTNGYYHSMFNGPNTQPQHKWYKLSFDISLTDEQVNRLSAIEFQEDFVNWLGGYLKDDEVATMYDLVSATEASILTPLDS